ncbi:hypothetical protein ONZ45_g129 [Pleurotus djamor]|nr:hypothetical protein ONZ45_g129 [Pleurotus djamor]
MSRIIIRRANEKDEAALSRICLLTANAGDSSEELHSYGELPGLVYAIPYVKLPTTFGFVMEVEETKEVVGYVLSSTDTRTFEREASATWWPAVQAKFPLPKDDEARDTGYDKELKDADKTYIDRIWNFPAAPDANIAFSPAHLHIDILDAYQKQGWGRKLIAEAVKHLSEQGIDGVWVGLDPRNENAKAFYRKLGFKEIVVGADSNMGLKVTDFVAPK